MDSEIKSILRALLLSTGEPLSAKDIQSLFARYREERAEEVAAGKSPEEEDTPSSEDSLPELVTVTRVREAMEALQAELEEKDEVYRIIEGPRGYQLACAPQYADWIRLLRDEPRPLRLTPAALETLTIIAYRQPVTRAEMENIRGVSVDSALGKLLELELAQIVGRAELPGRPIQYGITDRFLEFAGIKSIEELPASDIISSKGLDSWLRELNNREEVSDEDVGLPGDDFEDNSSVAVNLARGAGDAFEDDNLQSHSS